MNPIRVLELRSVAGTGGGPDKTILAGASRSDPSIALTVCYLCNVGDPLFPIGKQALDLGLDYVEIRERHSLDPSVLACSSKARAIAADRHRSRARIQNATCSRTSWEKPNP